MADEGERMLGKLAKLIPGYGAYVEQESRREDDRRTRAFLAKRLDEAKDQLDELGRRAVASGDIQLPVKLEALRSKLDHAQQRLTAAVEGYSAWFSNRQVDSKLLSEIAELDANLVSLVDQLNDLAKQADDDQAADELAQAASLLDQRIDRRKQILQDAD